MENDTYYKMQSFNQALLALVRQGVITEQEALATSSTPDDLKLGFRGIVRRASAGEMDSDFSSFRKPGKSPGGKGGSGKSGIQRGFEF